MCGRPETVINLKPESQWRPGITVDQLKNEMKRIAAPMVGGVITSTILELIIYPAIYMLWKGREFKSQTAD